MENLSNFTIEKLFDLFWFLFLYGIPALLLAVIAWVLVFGVVIIVLAILIQMNGQK